jgi:hypothetical protein
MICSAIVRRFDYSWLAEIQKDLALGRDKPALSPVSGMNGS